MQGYPLGNFPTPHPHEGSERAGGVTICVTYPPYSLCNPGNGMQSLVRVTPLMYHPVCWI
jgi:hypothetical protein